MQPPTVQPPPVTTPPGEPPVTTPPTDDPLTQVPVPPADTPGTTPPGNTDATPGSTTPDAGSGTSSDPANANISQQPYYLQDAASVKPVGTVLSSPGCSLKYLAKPTTAPRPGPDPWWPAQWYLSNTGTVDWGDASPSLLAGTDLNLAPLGAAYKGSGIRVAVVDDGVDFTHDDLRFSVLPSSGFDFRSQGQFPPLPCSAEESHGTAVAGLIAAQENNGLGMVGVAPQAKLIPLNALSTGNTTSILEALSYRDTPIEIFNNSWGAFEGGHFETPISPAAYRAAIEQGLRNGRGGRGSIYVFSAGNGGCDSLSDPHCQTELSIYDGYVTQYGALSICAVNAQGRKTIYSEPGANLLVCAPTSENDGTPPGTISTGLNDSYVAFSGTSSAAPMVSGIIARMLQANPSLSWRDVRLILARTARRVDPQHPGWRESGGLHFNHSYGFGLVDAAAAVEAARSWQSVGGSAEVRQCGPFTGPVGSRPVPQVSRDTAPLDPSVLTDGYLLDTIEIPESCGISHVEHVDLTLRMNTAGFGGGDLHALLTSPSGQTSVLTTQHECRSGESRIPCYGLEHFTFGISRHLDEPAVTPTSRGWTLALGDWHRGTRPGSTSTDAPQALSLQGWELTLYGR